MNITKLLKYSGLSALVLGIAVGCAGTPAKKETTPAATPAPQETQAAPETAPVTPPTTPTASDQYTVVRGDCLWNIAGKDSIYGNPYEWPLIYKANQDKIKDADLIYPGQVFSINRNASSAEIDAAVHHAKTRGRWSLGVVEQSDKAYLAQ